ncbi:MAG: hypothetical protein RLZZ76_191, partial [Candidatus Parcubacteria bacterium]
MINLLLHNFRGMNFRYLRSEQFLSKCIVKSVSFLLALFLLLSPADSLFAQEASADTSAISEAPLSDTAQAVKTDTAE